MAEAFNSFQMQVIQTFLGTRTPDYIATLIHKPVDQVEKMIKELTAGTRRLPFRDREHNKKLKEKKEKANHESKKAVQKKVKSEASRKARLPQRAQLSPAGGWKERNNKVFENKKVDYSRMKLIRIDSRTQIYVDKSADEEKIRKQFLKNRGVNSIGSPENPWKKMK